jgi:hypothetical protein
MMVRFHDPAYTYSPDVPEQKVKMANYFWPGQHISPLIELE